MRKSYHTTLNKELLDQLKIQAIKFGVNQNDLIEVMIKLLLDETELRKERIRQLLDEN